MPFDVEMAVADVVLAIHPSVSPSNKQAWNTYCRNHLSRNSDIIWSPLGSKHHVLVYSISLDSTLAIKHRKQHIIEVSLL